MALLGSGVVVRKIICLLVVVGIVASSAYAFLTASAVLGTAAAVTGGAAVASALTILMAKLGLHDIIETMFSEGAARQAEYQRHMDQVKDALEQAPDPDWDNQWNKWKAWASAAFTGGTRMSITPGMIQPIANVFEVEYNLTGDMRYWLASKTAGFLIDNTYFTVVWPPSWVTDLVPGVRIIKGRNMSAKINYPELTSTSSAVGDLVWGTTSSYYGVNGTDGSKWYKWDNYHIYVYSDIELAYMVRDKQFQLATNYINIALYSNGFSASSSYKITMNEWNDAEKGDVALKYLTNFIQGIRLAASYKMLGQSYIVKKVVSTLQTGYNPMYELVPEEIPLAESDNDMIPSVIADEEDLIDRSVNIFNDVDEYVNKYLLSPKTLEDVRVNPTGDFDISQALGYIRYEDGVPSEWWVNGVKWADIVDNEVIYGNDAVGYISNGSLVIYQDQLTPDPEVLYTIGNSLIFTQRGTTLYMGGIPVGSRNGDIVMLFGNQYTADSNGIQVGNTRILSGGPNTVVTINLMDMQTLQNSLNSTVAQLSNIANELNQGTAINNQVLTNSANILDYIQSVNNKVDSIMSSLESAGASVTVDLGPIELLLEGIDQRITELATMASILPAMSSEITLIQEEMTNLASTTYLITNISNEITSISESMTDVASSTTVLPGISQKVDSIFNSISNVIEGGITNIENEVTGIASQTAAIPGMVIDLDAIKDDINDLSNSLAGWSDMRDEVSLIYDSISATATAPWALPGISATVNSNSEKLTAIDEKITTLEETIEGIDLTNIEDLLSTEFEETHAMREDYEKPLIEDVQRDIGGRTQSDLSVLEEGSVWKKLFWIDIPTLTNAANTLKVAASEHFPFSIFTVVSDIEVNISDEAVAIPFVLDLGAAGSYSFDWLNSDLANAFKSVFKPISTLFIWAYFIGFLVSLRPKVAID